MKILPLKAWTWILSKKEKELFTLIMAMPADSLWHAFIKDFQLEPSYGHFLDLCLDLKLQAADYPATMSNLIGAELVQKLENWKL